jgi:hypothetical protein
MKKIKLNPAKLQLNKEKIANLTNEEKNNVNGGGILWSRVGKCDPSNGSCTCPAPDTTWSYQVDKCFELKF